MKDLNLMIVEDEDKLRDGLTKGVEWLFCQAYHR